MINNTRTTLMCLLVVSLFFGIRVAEALPTVGLVKALNAPSNPIESGVPFDYNMAWSCPGAITPADDCVDMVIVEPLPAELQATILPFPDGKLSKVCIQNQGDPVPNYASCTQPGGTTNTGATLHFIFSNPIIAGESGSLGLEVRFPAGSTPDGVTAINTATISATGATTVMATSNPISASAQDELTITKTLTSAGAINFNTIYRIRTCPSADDIGFITPGNVVVTDILPTDAVFVSANPAIDGGTGTNLDPLIWDLGSLPSCTNINVTVGFPAGGSNIDGAEKTNETMVAYDSAGIPATPKMASVTHTLSAPVPGLSGSKSTSDSVVNPGQSMSYTIRANNTGNIPLGITISDNIPVHCDVSSFDVISSGNMPTAFSYGLDTNGDGTADSTRTDADDTPDGNGLVVPPAGFVTNISVEFGDSGNPVVNFGSSREVRINCDVTNPGRDGVAIVMPASINNTANISGANGANVPPTASPGRTITLRDPAANSTIQPDAIKTQFSPAGIVGPGENIIFNIAMTNSASYSSAPEQVVMEGAVFADLLPQDMTFVSSNLVGAAPAGCTTAPTIISIPDYNDTGRALVVWSWAESAPQCSLDRGDTVTYDLVATVGDTTPGGTVSNHIAFLGADNPDTVSRGIEGCSTSGGFVNSILTDNQANYLADSATMAAAGTADSSRLCHAGSRSFSVQRITNITSRKAVRGSSDLAFLFNADEPNNVGRTVQEGSVFWRLEIINTANVPLDSIELIDIVPFDSTVNPSGDSSSGVGTGVPLGSTWQPRFVDEIDLSSAPSGTRVYYTQAANPCRSNIVNVAGCNPMVTLADDVPLGNEAIVPGPGAAGEWSTELPNIASRVLAFRIVYPSAFQLPAGETLSFEFTMFAPVDAPITNCGDLATSACSNIAWNTFGFSYEEADIGLPNQSAPTRVGIVVQGAMVSTAALGDFVWHDTNENGVQDAEEINNGINNVLVELYSDPDGIPNNGDEVLISETRTVNHPVTNLPGYYHFSGLPPTGATDRYLVRFYPPEGFSASPANTTNDNSDSDGIETLVVSETLYQVSGIQLASAQDRPDIDQGFFQDPPLFSLGNRVWLDSNADSIDNDGPDGTLESSTGISGVTVELWSVDIDGDPVNGVPDASQLTNATGHYLFLDLMAGDYRVVIPAAQFVSGQPLDGLYSSGTQLLATGVLAEAIPVAGNSDLDVLDHGATIAIPVGAIPTDSVISGVVSLGPIAGEPINEVGTKGPEQTPGFFDANPDNRANLSVDFGFYSFSVGNRVWFDDDNDGLREMTDGGPVVGVTVEILDGVGNVIGSAITDASGCYVIDGISSGISYSVRVAAAAFQVTNPLEGFLSSTWQANGTSLAQDDLDHGVDNETPWVNGILSRTFNLLSGNLPETEEAICGNGEYGDSADNLALDFGFVLPGVAQPIDSPIRQPLVPPQGVPMISVWGLLLLMGLLGLASRNRRCRVSKVAR